MRKLYALVLVLFFVQLSFAQNNGNEWIVFGGPGKYYSFKISQTGIHRIDYTTLVNAGVPVASLNPKNFQVFGREKEVYILVEGEQDNSFDPGDYIEFYAESNNGAIDSLLYVNGSVDMPDQYFSLYNDTINYYFTWNTSINNKRMIQDADTSYNAFTPVDWFWKESFIKSTNKYIQGELYSGASYSQFTHGEGWGSDYIDGMNNTFSDVFLSTPNAFQGVGAPDAIAKAVIIGVTNSGYSGTGNHHTQIQYGPALTLAHDSVYLGYKMLKLPFTLANSALGATTRIRYQGVNDQGVSSDYQSIGSTSLMYPHSTNLSNSATFSFELPINLSESKTRIDFINPGSTSFYFYDLTDTVRKIEHAVNGSTYPVLIPNHATNAKCYISSPTSIINVSTITPVNGSGDFTDYASLNLNNAFLIITHSSLVSGSQQYAAYRNTPNGGAYNVLVVDVDELYHQYGSGIEKHALGIRRFLGDLINNWTEDPEALFFIGKSIREADESTNGYFPGTRKNALAFSENLVPSFGYPSADVLFSAGFQGTFLNPVIPTGRLSARTNQEITDYLSKVMQYESYQDSSSVYTIEDKEWMKQIIHFGGGSSTLEQAEIAGYLSNYENVVEDLYFGGNVHTYLKQTSDPIDPNEYEEVMDLINEGVSLITFFGHSSVNGFDQNIDEPVNWSNSGKYPLLLANACYSGDIHQPGSALSASEDFVLQPNKGVIGFISSIKQGFAGTLHIYSTEFYNQLSVTNYGARIGELMNNTIQAIQPLVLNSIPIVTTCTQMTLHGDPALRLNYHVKPEIAIRTQDVFYEPSSITLADDSLTVNFIVTNIGKATNDSLRVEVHRQFPNGADSTYLLSISGLNYKDTISLNLPVEFNIGTGINLFDFLIDIPNYVDEIYDEFNNNQVTSSLFIYSNGISPVYPYEFAIVPDSAMNLKASTFNPLIGIKPYRFEIDTTDLFNSPIARFQIVNAAGGVVECSPANWLLKSNSSPAPLVFADSTVYYWRVSPDSTSFLWDESSFQYINDLRGWGQAHYYQFEENYHETMLYDRSDYGWKWDPNIRRIGCEVYGLASNSAEINGTFWSIDGASQDYGGCMFDPGIHVAVIDPVTLNPWGTYGCDPTQGGTCPGTCVMLNADHQFGNLNDGCSCRGRVEYYFNFRQNTPAEMDSLLSMVNNHVPNGYYILMYTWRFADYSTWTPAHYSMMNALGVDSIYPGRPNEPWIALIRKGDPAFSKIVIGDTINDFITMSDTLYGFDYIGSMNSPLIGPSQSWEALYWERSTYDAINTDSTRIAVYGVDTSGIETLLLDTLYTLNDSIINLASIVNANTYPKIKLRAWCKDTTYFTPSFFNRWQVVYQPVPELAVNGSEGFYFSVLSDSLEEGEPFQVAIAIENISEYNADSVLVLYWLEDQNRIRNYYVYPRQDSLYPGDILLDTITFTSTGYPGLNSLWLEVNPVPLNANTTNYDQPEQYHFNNFAQIPFYVKSDITNPILDVTFDGVHILNGDIVSAKPFIMITLNDENEYLVMNEESDTAFFAVYLKDPSGNLNRIYFRNGTTINMQWYPSSGPNGKFKIELNPNLPVDGRYTLQIQATDKSGNKSGAVDYKIQFDVINKPSITEILNYPNPFTTKTHFVFTLTGSELPDFFKIQIMTITGKVVKEITMEEMGTIRIGRNVTDYFWDGTDMYGDRLANGIYLYRVVARLNGSDIEKRESGADEYITKGFGKMYLMR